MSQKDIYDGGRFINHLDIKEERKVCVIGERTKKELFSDDINPIGKYINKAIICETENFTINGNLHNTFLTKSEIFQRKK